MPNAPKRAVAILRIAFCEDCHHPGGAKGVPWLEARAAARSARNLPARSPVRVDRVESLEGHETRYNRLHETRARGALRPNEGEEWYRKNRTSKLR
jgi:hypothetical protein